MYTYTPTGVVHTDGEATQEGVLFILVHQVAFDYIFLLVNVRPAFSALS